MTCVLVKSNPAGAAVPEPSGAWSSSDVGEICTVSARCKDPSMRCYEKYPGAAICRRSCVPKLDGMSCVVLGARTPVPLPLDPSTQADNGEDGDEQDCTSIKPCGGASRRCYERYPGGPGRCMPACSPGKDRMSCKLLQPIGR